MWKKQSGFSELKTACNKVDLLVSASARGHSRHYTRLVHDLHTTVTLYLRIPIFTTFFSSSLVGKTITKKTNHSLCQG